MERRALIVEDDELFVEILTRIIKPFGLTAVSVATAAGAVAELRAREAAVIFLDLHLSGPDGGVVIDFLRRMKPHLLGRVLVLTSHPRLSLALAPDVPVIDKGNLGTLGERVRALLEF